MSGVDTDPRGPYRTVASVELTNDETGTSWSVRFEECDHVASLTAHHAERIVGERCRCFGCRVTS